MINIHLKNEVQKGIFIVQLVYGKNATNEDVYFYVSIRGKKLDAFAKAVNHGNFNINEFGSILESGKGKPDKKVRQRMEIEYGFDHFGLVFEDTTTS